jgi:hypothetical protein
MSSLNYNSIIKVPFTMEPYMFKFEGNPISRITHKSLIHKIKENELGTAISFGEIPSDILFKILKKINTYQKKWDIYQKFKLEIEGLNNEILSSKMIISLLSLQIEEDIGIIHDGKLIAGYFASPTNWNPLEKKDLSLVDIHKPVADNKKLLRAMKSMPLAICGNHMFCRHIWTIAPTDNMSMHPKYKDKWKKPEKINDLFLRVETQTTVPIIKNSTALFLIKINIIPLIEVFKTHRNLITNSINSMSEDILTYKNLHDIKTIINQTVGEVYV